MSFGTWLGGWLGGLFGLRPEPVEFTKAPHGTATTEPVASASVSATRVRAQATASLISAVVSVESIEVLSGPFDRTFDRTFAPLGSFGLVSGMATSSVASAAASSPALSGEGTSTAPGAQTSNTTAGGSVSNAPPVSRRRTTFDRTFGSAF